MLFRSRRINWPNGEFWSRAPVSGPVPPPVALPPAPPVPPPPVVSPPALPPVAPGPACTVKITDVYWYLTSPQPYAIFLISADKWTSAEVGWGREDRSDFWGTYQCVGTNSWEFRSATGKVFRLTLRGDGTLNQDGANPPRVFHR